MAEHAVSRDMKAASEHADEALQSLELRGRR
jgi:hypothetical protein